tara:strand:- start:13823 stop:14113 length:291 start_codon:yes stop_codon:yes gene_type:complete
MAQSPIFLERRSYRLRRMMDAVRLLPLLGLLLWMVPLLWPVPPDGAAALTSDRVTTGVALRYLFGVWAALIIATWALWRRTLDPVDGAAPRTKPDP